MTTTRVDPLHNPTADVRRRVLAGGAAALAFGALGGSRVSAAGMGTADSTVLRFAQQLELSLRDLYEQAMDVDPSEPLWSAMSEHHEAYAHAIAGVTGTSASGRNDEFFGAHRVAIRSADRISAAYELESAAAATHLEVIGMLTDVGAAEVIASIISAESRHCVVLADVMGKGNDLSYTLENSAIAVGQ